MSQNIPIFIPTYISDQNYSPTRVQPRLLYYNGQVDCQPYYLVDGESIAREVTQFPYFDNYSVPSGSQFPEQGSKSLLFFNEQAVYGSTPTGSLFSEYWSNYVNLLYNPRTRLVNASAIIPLADYFKMELNDIVDLSDFDIARKHGKSIKKIYDIKTANIPQSTKKMLIYKQYITDHQTIRDK